MKDWKHREFTDEEIKEVVRDVYDGKILTSLQCKDIVSSVFMVSFFLGCPPFSPTLTDNNQRNRKIKLDHINDCLKYERETPEREEYLNNIGLFYEYIEKANNGLCINGFPIFYSCHIMSIADTKRFIDMYNKYVKLREDFEKDWK